MEFFQYEAIHEAFGRNDFASLQYTQDGKAVGKVIVCFLSRFVILAYFPHLDVGGSPEEFAEVGEGGRSAAGRKRDGQSV